MTAIRLIAADLDGTLLDPNGELSPRTLDALAAAHAAGVRIVLATARRYTGAQPFAQRIGVVSAVIVYDGGQTRAFPDGSILDAHHLPAARGQRVAELLYAQGLQPIAQRSDRESERLIVGPQPAHSAWADAYLAATASEIEHVGLESLCAGRPDPLRVAAFGPLGRLKAAARVIAADEASEGISNGASLGIHLLPRGNYGTAELTVQPAGVSKGAALRQLALRFDVPMAHFMAIGDGLNDVPMLRVAGVGVAMSGAPKALLRVADVVTPSNASDGAAQAIERYVLNQAAEPLTDGRAAVAPGVSGSHWSGIDDA
ncbi:MAG TPA: HAD family hydrolase [Ktedonobacterales bacterium]